MSLLYLFLHCFSGITSISLWFSLSPPPHSWKSLLSSSTACVSFPVSMASSRVFWLSPLLPPGCVAALPHLCCCSCSCHCPLKRCSGTGYSLWSLTSQAVLWFCELFSLKPANPPAQWMHGVTCKNGGAGAEASLLLNGGAAKKMVTWCLNRKSYR